MLYFTVNLDRQYKITILDPDLYDFKKCLAKVVAMCPVELVQGSVPQKDFKELQEEHIRLWHKNAYSRKYPVTNLGLQVNSNCTRIFGRGKKLYFKT